MCEALLLAEQNTVTKRRIPALTDLRAKHLRHAQHRCVNPPDVPWEDALQATERTPSTLESVPPERLPSTDSLPGEGAPLDCAPGSPFVVGRPLRANEPIFGRDDAFRFISGQLAKFSSVNVVGERRMGKTSLLNHLVGRPDAHLVPQPSQPPLVLARLDLQAGASNQERFYGIALRELLAHLPRSSNAEVQGFHGRRERLHARPEASYDELERVLRRLRDVRGVCVRPVLVVDELERLLDPTAREGFPFPGFFDGARALITADLLAMVVFSRRPLADYFRDPALPGSLTSTFPSYFTPITLSSLDDAAADALLLQPSDRTLTLKEISEARRWAGGHPCHLQAAGQACYEAREPGRGDRWARRRFAELKRQSCMAGDTAGAGGTRRPRSLWRPLRWVFWDLPVGVGRVAQHLGARFDDMAAWLIGAVLILLLVLVALGVANWEGIWQVIRKGWGLE